MKYIVDNTKNLAVLANFYGRSLENLLKDLEIDPMAFKEYKRHTSDIIQDFIVEYGNNLNNTEIDFVFESLMVE